MSSLCSVLSEEHLQGEVYGAVSVSLVDTSGTGVVSQGGGVALVETARVAGLDRALSTALVRSRKPVAIHDPGRVITGLAIALAMGGDCLAVRGTDGCSGGSPRIRRCRARCGRGGRTA